MTNTNMNRIPTNGNCKAVRDITNNKRYGSITEAAMANGVSLQAVSVAISKGKLCNGNVFMLEKDLHKCTDVLCEQIAKANARAVKAEATETEMAEFRQWKAEREMARKAKEEYEAAITKANAKVARRREICERLEGKLQMATARLMEAESELESLKGNGKEVE